MTAKECIKGRRSVRKFSDKSIEHDVLNEIIETASYSPSWKHTQITRYIAVEDKDLLNKIGLCTSAYPPNGQIIASAPMLIAVTVIKNRSGYERDGSFSTNKGSGWQMFDAGIASQSFCLAAYEKGIASVVLGIYDEEEITSLLEIPSERELIALIPIGYPTEEPTAPRRKPVEELIIYK